MNKTLLGLAAALSVIVTSYIVEAESFTCVGVSNTDQVDLCAYNGYYLISRLFYPGGAPFPLTCTTSNPNLRYCHEGAPIWGLTIKSTHVYCDDYDVVNLDPYTSSVSFKEYTCNTISPW